jgi:hypothetical protein
MKIRGRTRRSVRRPARGTREVKGGGAVAVLVLALEWQPIELRYALIKRSNSCRIPGQVPCDSRRVSSTCSHSMRYCNIVNYCAPGVGCGSIYRAMMGAQHRIHPPEETTYSTDESGPADMA